MSDTNRVGIRIQKNAERETPVTLGTNQLKALRITGTPNLAFTPTTQPSNELRPDRQVADLPLVGAGAGGDVGFELSFGTFDDLIESALLSAWNLTPVKGGTTAIAGTTVGKITLDDSSNFKVNHVVRFFNNGGTDLGQGVYYVTANTSNVLSVTPLDSNTHAVDASVTIDADTTLIVVGLRASSAGALDIAVSDSNMNVTAPAGFFTDAMGSGSNLVVG